jgi:hypothetical protein
MAVSLSLLAGAGWQFFDNSGNVLAGGRLFTYAAGTTTPLASYTSSTGLTANANPIILDSAGRVPNQVWLTDAVLYKFVLETSVISGSVQIGAWDNVFSQLNSISFGTTGLTPATATSGAVTVGGVLNVANGGTGLTALTAGRIPFGNGTAAFADAVGLSYNSGTNTLTAPIVSATTSITNAGNTLLSGTAARIQGDFSNATIANRTAFQDKTTNNSTSVQVLPNGTSQITSISSFNNSDPTNASYAYIYCDASAARLGSDRSGSGTYLPLQFVVNNTEAARFDTSQNFLHGATTTAGLVSNAKQTVGGIFSTVNGSVVAPASTATTLITLPVSGFSTWLISSQLGADDTPNYAAFAIVVTQNNSVRFIINTPGSLLTISNSGRTIQSTQSSGVSATIFYSAIRIM